MLTYDETIEVILKDAAKLKPLILEYHIQRGTFIILGALVSRIYNVPDEKIIGDFVLDGKQLIEINNRELERDMN